MLGLGNVKELAAYRYVPGTRTEYIYIYYITTFMYMNSMNGAFMKIGIG